jgi:hypothetical protein
MSLKNIVLVTALAAAGAHLVRQNAGSPSRAQPASPSPRPHCTPMPVSAMDPQPGLAPWRCMPETPGEGPDIVVAEPRKVYGHPDPLAPPPDANRRPPRSADLQELADWKAGAYLDMVDAEHDGDRLAAEQARADYVWASKRLDEARRMAAQPRNR